MFKKPCKRNKLEAGGVAWHLGTKHCFFSSDWSKQEVVTRLRTFQLDSSHQPVYFNDPHTQRHFKKQHNGRSYFVFELDEVDPKEESYEQRKKRINRQGEFITSKVNEIISQQYLQEPFVKVAKTNIYPDADLNDSSTPTRLFIFCTTRGNESGRFLWQCKDGQVRAFHQRQYLIGFDIDYSQNQLHFFAFYSSGPGYCPKTKELYAVKKKEQSTSAPASASADAVPQDPACDEFERVPWANLNQRQLVFAFGTYFKAQNKAEISYKCITDPQQSATQEDIDSGQYGWTTV